MAVDYVNKMFNRIILCKVNISSLRQKFLSRDLSDQLAKVNKILISCITARKFI
jgi:hypothetical protein